MSTVPRPALPVWKQTLRFLKEPFTLLEDARRECGDAFALRLVGLGEWIFLCSPALVREMFKAPTDVLAAGAVNAEQLGFMLGLDATFSLDGEDHLRRRRMVHPHLNGRRVLQHVPRMRAIAARHVAEWPAGRPFAFLPHGHAISLEVMIEALFGASSPATLTELRDLFETFSSRGPRSALMAIPPLQVDLGPWSPWGRILRLRRRTQDRFLREIERRLGGTPASPGTDVLDQLIEVEGREGTRLSAAALRDEVINLLFAGHETTGNILSWCLECILARPQVEERVRAELTEVVGDGEVEEEHVDRLELLDAVVNESIRYRPIAPMAGLRRVEKPFTLGGFELPVGAIVAQGFPAMARRADLWARPEVFDPEHFYRRKLAVYDWNPFGGGTRMCVGKGLAEVELKVVLATILKRSRLRLAQEKVVPVRKGFFFAPSRGLVLRLDERLRT